MKIRHYHVKILKIVVHQTLVNKCLILTKKNNSYFKIMIKKINKACLKVLFRK
jgi:hypothetical protein